MSVKTHLSKCWQSSTIRQVAGVMTGMAIAGGLYLGFEQIGSMQMGAMLVQPNTNISENADKVATAHKEVDQETARRLSQRAQLVANQMKQYTAIVRPEAAGTPTEQRTQERLAERQQQGKPSTQTHAAAVYADSSGAPVDQRERLAQRAEQNRQLRESAEAAAMAAAQTNALDLAGIKQTVNEHLALTPSAFSGDTVIVATIDQTDTLHSGAPLQKTAMTTPRAKNLTHSGSRENILVVLTLTGALGMFFSDRLHRTRFAALVSRRA